jgi:hypothetical protein
MHSFKVLSFHPRSSTEPAFRVFVNKRSGFYESDKELCVLGMALIETDSGTASIVPVFVYEGQSVFGRAGWDVDRYDSEIVIADPSVENVADYVYSEFARILPCPELDGVEQ